MSLPVKLLSDANELFVSRYEDFVNMTYPIYGIGYYGLDCTCSWMPKPKIFRIKYVHENEAAFKRY